jgi:hypothetical protein
MNERHSADFTAGLAVTELWLGLLLGPIAALSQLEANYALVLYACSSGQKWPLHLVSLLALTLTLVGFVFAFRNWQRVGQHWDDEGPGVVPRSSFMALLGILISVIMFLVIVAQWLGVFVYGPCHRWD